MSNTNDLVSRYLSKTSSEAYLLKDNKFPIKYWINSGNYALNALLSGYWDRGYPSGRFTQMAGPNSVGKCLDYNEEIEIYVNEDLYDNIIKN